VNPKIERLRGVRAGKASRGREFRGQHTHLSCSFQNAELGDSLGSGERSTRLEAVGVNAIWTLLTVRAITPTESTWQITPARESLEHLSRLQHRTTGGIEAAVNGREEESFSPNACA
jgi:hypothetical protein